MDECTIAVAARGGDRWYGRVTIPATTARAAGMAPGIRVSANRDGRDLLVSIDEAGRILLPSALGLQRPRHSFEASVRTLKMPPRVMDRRSFEPSVADGVLRIRDLGDVWEEAYPETKRRRSRLRDLDDALPAEEVIVSDGRRLERVEEAVRLEGRRSGRSVLTVTADELCELMRREGMSAERIGMRMFRIDERALAVHEMVDAWNALPERPKVVLCVS